MLKEQEGLCKICERPPKEGKKLYIDHDHSKDTEECVRGLLCQYYDTAIGMMEDDPDRLRKAVKYLELS